MTNRQIGVLLVILALLLGAIALKRMRPVEELVTQDEALLKLSIDSKRVDGIAIWKGANNASGVTLRHIDEIWQISNLWDVRANEEKVTQVLSSVRDISGELRGNSESLYEDFGLTDEVALHLQLSRKEDVVADLLLNPASSGWQSYFIREADSTEVYLVTDSYLLSRLGAIGSTTESNLKPSVWADFRLLWLDAEQVSEVELKERGGTWHLLGDPLPFGRGADKIQSYVKNLATLRASGVVDPTGDGYGLDDPEWALRFMLTDGDPVILNVGALKPDSDEARYVSISNTSNVYSVPPAALKRFRVDGSRFITDNPLAIERESLRSLRVQTKGQKVNVVIEDSSWDGLDKYLQALKTFRVRSVSALPDRKPKFKRHRIIIERADQTTLSIACENPLEDAHEFICRNEENQIPFTIARSTFEQLFDDLGRLVPPETPVEEVGEEMTEE